MSDWLALETDLPTDPLWLGQRLWKRPGGALLWSADGSGPSYLMSDPVEVASQLDPEPQLAFRQPAHPWGRWAGVPRWVGVLPYEAERERLERPSWRPPETRPAPLINSPHWQRYDAVCVIGRRVTIVGQRQAALDLLCHLREPDQRDGPLAGQSHSAVAAGRSLLEPRPAPAADQHMLRIEQALELIRAGDIYQVNLARRLDFDVHGTSLELLRSMGGQARPPYAAAIELGNETRFISTSPELFLRTYGNGRIETLPIKGTRPRGSDATSDRRLAQELEHDEKERAELSMVVDIERNDLGRIALTSSVRAEPASVVAHARVFHRQALVHAQIKPELDRSAVLRACLPSGSITGAPKIRAMEVIAQLEAARRGAYTGAYGFLAHDGNLHLAMAIRCLSVKGREGHYAVGGGIVADSVPARELLETEWKAVQVTRLASRA